LELPPRGNILGLTDGGYRRQYSGVRVLRPPRRSHGSFRSESDQNAAGFSRYQGLIVRKFATLKNSCKILTDYRLDHDWFYNIFSFCLSINNLNLEEEDDEDLYSTEDFLPSGRICFH